MYERTCSEEECFDQFSDENNENCKRKRKNAIRKDFVSGDTSDEEDDASLPPLPKIPKKFQECDLTEKEASKNCKSTVHSELQEEISTSSTCK